MSFILLDVILYITVSFTIGLYVGAFVQRRRDVRAFKLEKKINKIVSKYPEAFAICREIIDRQNKEGEII